MVKIQRFEDMLSWQKARQMTNLIYQITEKDRFSKDFELRKQIRRASGSIMHNIAEGFDAGSDAEFSRFLKIARRSASEVQSQLYLALDQSYISESELEEVYGTATEIKKLINGLLAYLRKS